MKEHWRTTRRGMLQQAGGIIAAAVFPTATRLSAQPAGPAITELSKYMSEAGGRSLPEEALEKTKEHILDTIAAMISGVDLPPARMAMQFARAHSGEKTATVVGSNLLCGAIEAALANGILAHSDETDDSHALSHSHPGCAVVPAALAAGEQFGIDGARFVRAVALGYDIGPRVTMTLGGLPYQMEPHGASHSIAGNFGAAAAAGSAASLNAQQMRWLLDYASQQASGIVAWQRDTEHIEKSRVWAGSPARNGRPPALWIQEGGTGVDDVFSGADNFLMAFNAKANPEKLIEELGQRYEVTQTNIK